MRRSCLETAHASIETFTLDFHFKILNMFLYFIQILNGMSTDIFCLFFFINNILLFEENENLGPLYETFVLFFSQDALRKK